MFRSLERPISCVPFHPANHSCTHVLTSRADSLRMCLSFSPLRLSYIHCVFFCPFSNMCCIFSQTWDKHTHLTFHSLSIMFFFSFMLAVHSAQISNKHREAKQIQPPCSPPCFPSPIRHHLARKNTAWNVSVTSPLDTRFACYCSKISENTAQGGGEQCEMSARSLEARPGKEKEDNTSGKQKDR